MGENRTKRGRAALPPPRAIGRVILCVFLPGLAATVAAADMVYALTSCAQTEALWKAAAAVAAPTAAYVAWARPPASTPWNVPLFRALSARCWIAWALAAATAGAALVVSLRDPVLEHGLFRAEVWDPGARSFEVTCDAGCEPPPFALGSTTAPLRLHYLAALHRAADPASTSWLLVPGSAGRAVEDHLELSLPVAGGTVVCVLFQVSNRSFLFPRTRALMRVLRWRSP